MRTRRVEHSRREQTAKAASQVQNMHVGARRATFLFSEGRLGPCLLRGPPVAPVQGDRAEGAQGDSARCALGKTEGEQCVFLVWQGALTRWLRAAWNAGGVDVDGGRNQERRKCTRYTLAFPIRYRVVPRNGPPLTGRGTTCDISSAGLSFLCREALPMGSHIEMVAQWPANADGRCPLDLKMTGFVVRSNQGSAAVRVTSHKLCADTSATLSYRASA